MKYTPSVNIEQNDFNEKSYIVTHNAKCVVGNIVDSFNAGIHSFSIIGSYGTGKSSFLLALEHSLNTNNTNSLIDNKGQFNGFDKFEFAKIVGDYASLPTIISDRLFKGYDSRNFFDNFLNYYKSIEKTGKFLIVIIDEFGKVLEYAAKNDPEKELYFLQKFAEFVNSQNKNIILVTTLHQNFNSYARKLSESQKNEWIKVKGRFKEIVFNEPVEQLLYLAAKRIEGSPKKRLNNRFEKIFELAINSKFASSSVSYETAQKLYPMDLFAAQALTLSIQRYGQNERTLFSFLDAKGTSSLEEFIDGKNKTYNLADVYDYDIYNFYSHLSEVNSDSANWIAMRVTIERIEGLFDESIVIDAIKLAKCIGMLNLFGTAGIKMEHDALCLYAKHALDIEDPNRIIKELVQYKIIRFAKYRFQYILFEGTDINIEDEILKASGIVPKPLDFIDKLRTHFSLPKEFANAISYRKGTPRYFEYQISEEPISLIPIDEIDGFINLIFCQHIDSLEKIKGFSRANNEAIIYAYFKRTEDVIKHLWEIDKLEFTLQAIDENDKVAIKEINALLRFEKDKVNNTVLKSLYEYNDDVIWVYKGDEVTIGSKTNFNKFLSFVCYDIYNSTPVFINEMVNKQKPSSAISVAKGNLLLGLLENPDVKDLNFDKTKYPPEKTIYRALLQNTGIHRDMFGTYVFEKPIDDSFQPLWTICEEFLYSTKDKAKKIGELTKLLKSRPLKLKQGFIDIWVPAFLIMMKNEYSLYDGNGVYVPIINKDVLEIFQRSINEFSIKAFNVDGIKLNLFNKYREAVSLSQEEGFTTNSLVETIRPFLTFYNRLNNYAKHTKKLNNATTVKFRSVIANATDPEKTFFEDLPKALGFKESSLTNNEEVLKRYVELIYSAIRDLRSCYVGLVDRLESVIVDAMNLKSSSFADYSDELKTQFSSVKVHLLTTKQKTFLNRVLSKAEDRIAWFESLAYIILDKKLDNLLDDEEEYLTDNLVSQFKELYKYVEISKFQKDSDSTFFRFEMISNKGKIKPQMVKLNSKKEQLAEELESKIDVILSGDNDVDIYTLLTILNKKING